MEIALVLGLLVAAIVLFSTERIGVDVVTGLLLVVLVLTGILTTGEAFAAFGTDFIVMLASIYVITNAVETSGVLDEVANRLSRSKPAKIMGLMLWLLPFTAIMSAFMNNTTLTALLIPCLLYTSVINQVEIFDCPALTTLPPFLQPFQFLDLSNLPLLSSLPPLASNGGFNSQINLYDLPTLTSLPALSGAWMSVRLRSLPQVTSLPTLPSSVRYLTLEDMPTFSTFCLLYTSRCV